MKPVLALLLSLFATAAVAGDIKVDATISTTTPTKVYAFLDKDELDKIKGALLELIKVDGDGHVICSTK